MALVTHHVQGSYAPSRPLSWKRGTESKRFLAAFPEVNVTEIILLKHTSCSCLSTPLIHGSKRKSLRISSFKGSVKNDESGHRASGSKSKSVKLSYVSKESEETLSETTARSLAVQNLFKRWLTLLHTRSPNQVAFESLEGPLLNVTVETEHEIQKSGRGEILNTIWCNFLGLDATVKIPAMIFIPMYMAVNIKYGAEIAKELSPLWIFGPTLVALYIKLLQAICSLYVSGFKHSIKVVNKVPAYYHMAYNYVAYGKLKTFLLQPVVDFLNFDYKKMSKRIRKGFQEWVFDEYVESIWPFYCKMIRFLKRVNFI